MVENWIGVAVVLLSILASHAVLNRELRDMRKDMAALVERMVRLEGTLDGFLAGFRAKGREVTTDRRLPGRQRLTMVPRSLVGMTGFEPATP